MLDQLSHRTTQLLRSTIRRGAGRLASSDRLMSVAYDLMNETNFAGLSEHEEMLSDRRRVDAYHQAIHRAVAPGDVVLDLGTGTGLLAFMAAAAGASKVYAVEHSDFIDVAREIAHHNNIETIEFVQSNSREFTPPEPVDVIVHEQMGDELFNENMLANLLDVRDRVLRPGGRIVPAHFRLFVEPVTYVDDMRVRRFWNIDLPDNIDLGQMEHSLVAARFDTGRTDQVWVRPGSVESFIGEPKPVLDFDLGDLADRSDLAIDHVVERVVDADCVIDGYCVWFEAVFDAETTLSTSPLAPVTSWGNRLFRFDIDASAGDTVRAHVHLGNLDDPATWQVELL